MVSLCFKERRDNSPASRALFEEGHSVVVLQEMGEYSAFLFVTWQAGLYLDEERKCVILKAVFSFVQRPGHVCAELSELGFNCLLFFLWLTRAMVLLCQTHSLKARCPKERSEENRDFLCTSQHSRSILRRRKFGKSRPFGIIILVWAEHCAVTLGRALAHGWQMPSIFEMPSLKLGFCSQLSCSWEQWGKLKLEDEGVWLTIHFYLLSTLSN